MIEHHKEGENIRAIYDDDKQPSSLALMHYAYKLIQSDKIDAQRERKREQNRFCTKKPKLILFIF